MAAGEYDYTRRRASLRAPLTARQARDLLAVLLILAGLAGVVAVIFIACPLAGWGVCAALTAGLGALLALDRGR